MYIYNTIYFVLYYICTHKKVGIFLSSKNGIINLYFFPIFESFKNTKNHTKICSLVPRYRSLPNYHDLCFWETLKNKGTIAF